MINIRAADLSSGHRGHVIYQQATSLLAVENKVILIRRLLPSHIPSGHARASLSPGARGVGLKKKKKIKKAHTLFPAIPAARRGTGVSPQPRNSRACVRWTHGNDEHGRRERASGARRGSLHNDKQMRSGTHVARLMSTQRPRRCRRPQREAGKMWANLLLFHSFILSFILSSFPPSSFQGWVVRLFASGST